MTGNQKRKPSEVSADKHVWSLHAASFLLTVPDGFFFQSEWSVNVYVAVRFFSLSLSSSPYTPDISQLSGPPRGFHRSSRCIICWHISVALINSTVESIWQFVTVLLLCYNLALLHTCTHSHTPLQLLYNDTRWRRLHPCIYWWERVVKRTLFK